MVGESGSIDRPPRFPVTEPTEGGQNVISGPARSPSPVTRKQSKLPGIQTGSQHLPPTCSGPGPIDDLQEDWGKDLTKQQHLTVSVQYEQLSVTTNLKARQ